MTWRIDHRAVKLGAIGALSGALSGLVPHDGGTMAFLAVVPGLVFGLLIGFYLVRAKLATLPQAGNFAVFSTFGNFVAVGLSVAAVASFGKAYNVIVMPAAGMAGGTILIFAIWRIFPFYHNWRLAIGMVIACGVAGIAPWPIFELLSISKDGYPFMAVFIIWQMTFAVGFGLGFPKEKSIGDTETQGDMRPRE